MINILAIRCSLAFAPYISESAEAFLTDHSPPSRVIRQAANGLIVRPENALSLRHQNREAALDRKDVEHYLATVQFRQQEYDVVRTSDEVVFANLGRFLLLSHPQSEMWIDAGVIPTLLASFHGAIGAGKETLPEWLTLSGGNGRLLLSDQRNGRWVLLGSDHFSELERRMELLNDSALPQTVEKPPRISLKGLTIPLQAVHRLQQTLEEFAESGDLQPYEELSPTYQLIVMRALEGIKLSDGNLLVAMTVREAQKWAAILTAEIDKYNIEQYERGSIRTVLARVDGGVWIMQWGDEMYLSFADRKGLQMKKREIHANQRISGVEVNEFQLLLDRVTGSCVALTKEEQRSLQANSSTPVIE
jgi:hypothetical protein